MKKKVVVLLLSLVLLVSCTAASTLLGEPEYSYYIPLAFSFHQYVGVEAESSLCQGWYREGTNTRVSVRWMDVEKVRGVYDWSSLDKKLCGHQAYMITVKNTPEWARVYGEPSCKLPNSSHLKDLYRFLRELDRRYKPSYIEVWNEPDARKESMPENHYKYYGCIGDGVEYGEFFYYLYKNVKEDINSKLVIGAVSSIHSRFTYDMMVEVKDNYDALSLHCYAQYWEVSKLYNFCGEQLEYAKTLTDKEVILSETAVLFKSGNKREFERAQVDYYKFLLKQNNKFFWYTCNYNGWPRCEWICNSDLVYFNLNLKKITPRPVWYDYYYP